MEPRLAPYAASDASSRGRRYGEPPPQYRNEYQRDRDRVIHSAAFRRLEYKTQVFVNHEGDMFRTRLTHSIEVAQIARTVARALRLNEDLTEAIALAHDLGHTPFGHAGQDALNACMREYGGFEHNRQSLRVVDLLEERYAAFPGLNLTFETREGILKHCSRGWASRLGEVGERFLQGSQPGLEAQITNLCDEIAYNSHDIDDGLRAGMLSLDSLRRLELIRDTAAELHQQWSGLPPRRLHHELVRRIINIQVVDLVRETEARIARARPAGIEEVRQHERPLAAFSGPMREQLNELKRHLREQLYHHYRVRRMSRKAGRVITTLFQAFMEDPALLPPALRPEADASPGEQAQKVADYIAGMTDRFAIQEYRRLTDPEVLG